MPRMLRMQVLAWSTSRRVRSAYRRLALGAFALLLSSLLWWLLIGPQSARLVAAFSYGILFLLALAGLVVVACGGLEHIDPAIARLGWRLGRPSLVMLAALWAWAGAAAIAGWAAVSRLLPLPGSSLIESAEFDFWLLFIPIVPLVVLYAADWGRQRFRR